MSESQLGRLNLLERILGHEESSAAVISPSPGRTTTWSELATAVRGPDEIEGVMGLQLSPDASAIGRFLARVESNRPVVLLPPGEPPERLADELGLDWIWRAGALVSGPGGATGFEPGDVAIVTSGTTGKPKVVRHSLPSLLRAVRGVERLEGTVWLQTYPLSLYAGLQVLFHCVLGGATLVIGDGDAERTAQRMVKHGVTHVSATPSWWRRLVLFADREVLKRVPLRQATLGGEVADQAILDGIHHLWPEARVAHIYATSELGRCFSVVDGREGFPVGWLQDGTPDGVVLKHDQGELLARSPNQMRGYLSQGAAMEWVRTGDLVQVSGDRVRFVGRVTERINVGGNKVDPLQVENILRRCEEVRDVRVYAKRSSLVGELVAADVVPKADPAAATEAVKAWAREQLSAAQRPRIWRLVDEIEVSAAGKRVRSP